MFCQQVLSTLKNLITPALAMNKRRSAAAYPTIIRCNFMDDAILQRAFFQARLKIFRAKSHYEEARIKFVAYAERDFCRLVVDTESMPGEQIIRVIAEPLSAHLILSIGDMFHNLNAAMDYVMTGMMRAAGLSSTRISFPTNESRSQLRKSFMMPKKRKGAPDRRAPSNRRIVEGFPAFVMQLLTNLKPYPGGDFFLWEVTKADNIDKHNLIIPTTTVTRLNGVHLKDEARGNVIKGEILDVSPGGVVNFARHDGNLSIIEKGRASVNITFPKESEVFPGCPVFPTLIQCIEGVEQAVALIEASNFRRFVRTKGKGLPPTN